MSHLENQLPQDLSLGARFQMAKEMYDRRVVKSQAAAAAMIPMNCSTFNYHYNGGLPPLKFFFIGANYSV
jgi:hypothetical protein